MMQSTCCSVGDGSGPEGSHGMGPGWPPKVRSCSEEWNMGDKGLVLFGATWSGPQEPTETPRTHTCPADAIEIVTSLALAAEASRGVHTQVPRPTGLRGWRTLIHILQKRKAR